MAQTVAAPVCLRSGRAPYPFPFLSFDNYTPLAYSVMCALKAYLQANGIHPSSGFHPACF